MKYGDNVDDPLYFPLFLQDCLCHVSFRRCSPLSLEVVEKPNKYTYINFILTEMKDRRNKLNNTSYSKIISILRAIDKLI